MNYGNTVRAVFVKRLNRFAADVELNGMPLTVHVKNTGRLRELLIEGALCALFDSANPARKYRYDLVAVYKDGLGWVNVDSQAPNRVALEWLKSPACPLGHMDFVRPEYVYGNSRVDIYAESGSRKLLIEVKGCTLNIGGRGYFPDAPTERGVKHLNELANAARNGYECYIAFVIGVPGVTEVFPNDAAQPEFGEALKSALTAGVRVLNITCDITENSIIPKNE